MQENILKICFIELKEAETLMRKEEISFTDREDLLFKIKGLPYNKEIVKYVAKGQTGGFSYTNTFIVKDTEHEASIVKYDLKGFFHRKEDRDKRIPKTN